ncbi:MAG TPA: SdiA-regulated domain-containing protein [Vicinamibacteria bacterium]|nr:SdiA-regulated domain-containing protein [Vicinamibacteria bacterium]
MAADDRSRRADERDEDDTRGQAAARAHATPAAPARATPVVAAPAEVVPLPAPADRPLKAGKPSKKERRFVKDAHRPLESWERYRALTDVLEEAIDLVDLADHKARFALIIMGALNALLFIMASQTDVFDAVPAGWRPFMALVIAVYALIAVYFVIQAIESLRPRKAQPQVRYASETGLEDFPVGLRFYEDILSRDLEAYRRSWRELRIGQLNAELAVQAHALAQINKAKYSALRRLYFGLQLMTVMAVLLMGVGSYLVLSGKARRLDLKGGLLGERPGAAFGTPQRFAGLGMAEPSGVAFHPPSGHLFVVGDDGKLAELDTAGNVVRSVALAGDLEGVAVHTPTGDLVVLAERNSELILYDPVGLQERKRWRLDKDAVLGRPGGDRNEGFEGLAFRPDPTQPGGGMFYLAHQREPAAVVALAFDVNRPAGALGADVVKGRWELSGYEDLTAITWVAELDRLLAVSDAQDVVIVMRTDGTVERDLTIPGKQQEGIAVDAEGNVWIADDRDKSVLKLAGGLDVLRGEPASPGQAAGRRPGPPIPE